MILSASSTETINKYKLSPLLFSSWALLLSYMYHHPLPIRYNRIPQVFDILQLNVDCVNDQFPIRSQLQHLGKDLRKKDHDLGTRPTAQTGTGDLQVDAA